MIKKFTELKNEVLYKEVQGDLISKEFSYHDYYYNILTKLVHNGKEYNDNDYNDSESDFSAVERFILSNISENHEAVSMRALPNLYNVKQENDRRDRHKLKIKLKNWY